MIVICEKCLTKFNIDESILKKKGSKVRCNICKNIFIAYPFFKEEIKATCNNKDKKEKIEYLEKNLSFPEFYELLGKEKFRFKTKINITTPHKKDIKETTNSCNPKSPNNKTDKNFFPKAKYHSKQIPNSKFIYDFGKNLGKIIILLPLSFFYSSLY